MSAIRNQDGSKRRCHSSRLKATVCEAIQYTIYLPRRSLINASLLSAFFGRFVHVAMLSQGPEESRLGSVYAPHQG
jgi:hypothetical protein